MFMFFFIMGIISIFIAVMMVGALPDGRQHRNKRRSCIKHKNSHNSLSNWVVSLAIAGVINYFTN